MNIGYLSLFCWLLSCSRAIKIVAIRSLTAASYLSVTTIATTTLCAEEMHVTIANDKLSVIFSKKGAELQSIRHLSANTEYLWQGDPQYWSGRSPNMFPVNVKFRDGGHYTYKGVSYTMPSLGVVKSEQFHVDESTSAQQSASKIKLVLNASAQTLQYYPFPFRLEIAAEVQGLTLTQTYTVINTGQEPLYFALGSHPGFRAPFTNGRDRSDYELRFARKLHVQREEVSGGLVTGKRIEFLDDEDRFALDDARVPNGGMLLWDFESRKISVAQPGHNPYLTLDLGDFPNTNIWTPPGMPFVCIEPMLGHHDFATGSDAIEEKSYLTKLPAGESKSYRYSISIHPEEGIRALANPPISG